MKLTPKQRATVFAMFDGHCAYCGEELPEKGWHADHIEPIIRKTKLVRVDRPNQTYAYVQTGECYRPENSRIDNFFPSCRACNIDKGCSDIESWRQGLENLPAIMRRNHSAWRHAERFKMVAVVQPKITFYFEAKPTASTEVKA